MSEKPSSDMLTRSFLVSGLVMLATVALVYGSGVLVPLAIAFLIWFLINAISRGFQKISMGGKRLPRSAALVLALVTVFAIGMKAMDLVVTNLTVMSTRTIDFETSLNPLIDKFAEWSGLPNKEILNKIFDSIGIEKLFGRIVGAAASLSGQLGVVIVYIIFLLIEQQFFDLKLNALIKDEDKRNRVNEILQAIAHDVQSYMWIMTLLSGLTAVISWVVMQWVGLEHAAFWAFLIFILNFIPTVGSILSTMLPAIFALIQFQRFSESIELLLAIGVIQFVIGNFLQPRLAGQTLNMSQFVVVLSLFIWGAVWGVTGMFLAVPLTAIMMIVLANFETTRTVAILMSEKGNLERREA